MDWKQFVKPLPVTIVIGVCVTCALVLALTEEDGEDETTQKAKTDKQEQKRAMVAKRNDIADKMFG